MPGPVHHRRATPDSNTDSNTDISAIPLASQCCEHDKCSTLFTQTALNRLITKWLIMLGKERMELSTLKGSLFKIRILKSQLLMPSKQRQDTWGNALIDSFLFCFFLCGSDRTHPVCPSFCYLPGGRIGIWWQQQLMSAKRDAFHHLLLIACLWSASRQMLHGDSLKPCVTQTPPL